MTEIIGLDELKPGEKGRVAGLYLAEDMKRRLQDMGLVDGAGVECIHKSPLGDPKAYLIKGAVIAIRNEDSVRIRVECETGGGYGLK